MKQQNEFKPEQQQQQQAAEQQAGQQQAYEFSSTEDLLRFDSDRTTVPTAIAERLQKSSADLPRPGRSWWQKLFGR